MKACGKVYPVEGQTEKVIDFLSNRGYTPIALPDNVISLTRTGDGELGFILSKKYLITLRNNGKKGAELEKTLSGLN